MFTNPKTGKKFSASVIASVLGLNVDLVYDNLEYVHPIIGVNTNIVNSEVDVSYETNKILINIEFNRSNGIITRNKNEAYVCGLYLRQLPNSDSYKLLKPIIQINIDAYDYYNQNKFLYKSMLMETNLHLIESENIIIYHIALPILREMDYNSIRSDEDRLKELLYILVCEDKEELDKLYEGDKLMSEVRKELQRNTAAIDQFLYYNKEELERLDLEEARRLAMEEGTKVGFEKGHDEGFEQGIEQGHKTTQLEIAKKLLQTDLSMNDISNITGLSVLEIENLKK